MMPNPQEQIRQTAATYGFDEVRFAQIEPVAGIKEYDRFLEQGHHGEMEWMKNSRNPRARPLPEPAEGEPSLHGGASIGCELAARELLLLGAMPSTV